MIVLRGVAVVIKVLGCSTRARGGETNCRKCYNKKLWTVAITAVAAFAIVALVAAQVGDSSQPAPCSVTVAVGESIQDAIDSVADGCVICLEAGTYEEIIVIRKSLTLRGSGPHPSSTRIIPPPDGTFEEADHIALVGVGEWGDPTRIEVRIENLSVGGEIGWDNWALEATGQASLRMIDCEAGPSSGVGVQLNGSARATIVNTLIHENRGYAGFNAGQSSTATLEDCIIARNTEGNLEAGGSAQVLVRSCLIEGPGGHHGIWLHREASVTAEDCVITGNRWQGVDVNENGTVSISNCDITENGENGVNVSDFGQAAVLDSSITKNGASGIAVHDGATAVLERNEVKRNSQWGVFFDGTEAFSRLRVTGCGNDIADERGTASNAHGDVYPDDLSGLLRSCPGS